jgi:hypothetical protein
LHILTYQLYLLVDLVGSTDGLIAYEIFPDYVSCVYDCICGRFIMDHVFVRRVGCTFDGGPTTAKVLMDFISAVHTSGKVYKEPLADTIWGHDSVLLHSRDREKAVVALYLAWAPACDHLSYNSLETTRQTPKTDRKNKLELFGLKSNGPSVLIQNATKVTDKVSKRFVLAFRSILRTAPRFAPWC